MSLIIAKPLEERRILSEADPSGETYVVVRQARQADELTYAEMTAMNRVMLMDGSTQFIGGLTGPELRQLECWLTFVNSNIMYSEKGDPGKASPLFIPGMDYEDFGKAFSKLPTPVTREWQEHVWWVNPDWAPIDHPSRMADGNAEKRSAKPSEST